MTKSDQQIRQAVRIIFGAEASRVTRNGEVHVWGPLPNSTARGWYLLGHTRTLELEEKLFYPDNSLRTRAAA